MSSADNHFSRPKYTQDEWDCAQDEIERLKARIKELENDREDGGLGDVLAHGRRVK